MSREVDSGLSKGYGFICFDSFDAADAAIESMNGQFLMNKQISLTYAFKKDGKGEKHGSVAGISININHFFLTLKNVYWLLKAKRIY